MAPVSEVIHQLSTENDRLREEIRLLRGQLSAPAAPGSDLLQIARPLLPAIVLTDARGYLLRADARAEQLGLLPAGNETRRTLPELLPPACLAGTSPASVNDLLARGQAFTYVTSTATDAADTSWLRIQGLPIAGSEPLNYACTLQDVTSDMQQQLRLAASELHCRQLVENAPVVLYEWRENFAGGYEWLYASPRLQQVFGLSQGDTGQLSQYIHPDDVDRWRHTIEESKRLGQPWHFEGRLQVPGQPLRWWRGSAIITAQDAEGIVYQGILEDVTPAYLAEETMQAAETRWRTAMQGVGSDIWEWDIQNQTLTLSEKFRELLGYSGYDKARPFPGFEYANVQPTDLEAARRTLSAYLHGDIPLFTATYHLTDAQGQPHWIASRGLVTRRSAAGEPELITGTHTDVTEITRAKLDLEASTRRLTSTVENLQRSVLLEDEHGRIVLANQAFCELFSLPMLPEELTGLDCAIVLEQIKPRIRDEEAFGQRITNHRRQRREVHGELLEFKDGRLVEHTTVPLYVEGQYIGQFWKYEDVTKRHLEAESLKRREEKYRSILENMNMGLMEANLEGRVKFANDSYCEITGYTKHELRSMAPEQLLVKIPRQGPQAIQGGHFTPGSPYPLNTYELPVRTKNQELKWLLVSEAPLWSDEKHIIGSIGVYLDITHQKQLEGKLREAKRNAEESTRAKEMFLANMSHEIRTPMNAIVGMSQLLSKTSLNGQQHSYLNAIASSAENLLVIINDILDLSKIDAGQMTLEHIGFSPRQLCEQVEKTLCYKAEDKGLTFRVDVCSDLPEVLLGDPHRIIQVLLNLAGNSVKFTERGEINLSCKLAGYFDTHVVIQFQVRDTGIGIDPQYLKHLFKNFSQEDSSISRKYGGTGLGLSISRRLVDLMGGELHIESEKSAGTTSTFSLQLAIGAPADLPRKEAAGSAHFIREGLRGKRVLLVEDNDYNRLLALSFLSQAHMEVTEAENGAVAVALARQQPFDIILMDVQMPVLNGYEATQQLRQELDLRTPIIALTANAIRGDNQRCLDAGMNDYLSKPFQEEELLKIMHEWLFIPVQSKAESPRLYSLAALQQATHNDQKFIMFMLGTFIKSSQQGLDSFSVSLEAGSLEGIRATAHKLKPSLHHLQIIPVLKLVEELEEFPEPFQLEELTPRIAQVKALLAQVNAQISADLAAMQASAELS